MKVCIMSYDCEAPFPRAPTRREMLRFVFLSALFAVVYSQAPKCESPKQWQGQFFLVDPTKSFEVFGNMTYDELGQRIAAVEAVVAQGTRDVYKVLSFYKTGVAYRENLQTKTCVKSAIKGPFRPIGVPPTAQFRGYVYIGSSQNEHSGIKVQQWYNQSDTAVLFATFTVVACVPVQDSYYSQDTGFVHTTFFNVQQKIDPSVFNIPKSCQ